MSAKRPVKQKDKVQWGGHWKECKGAMPAERGNESEVIRKERSN